MSVTEGLPSSTQVRFPHAGNERCFEYYGRLRHLADKTIAIAYVLCSADFLINQSYDQERQPICGLAGSQWSVLWRFSLRMYSRTVEAQARQHKPTARKIFQGRSV